MIDPSLLKPCIGCLARQQRQRESIAAISSPSHSSASASPSHSSASASPAHSTDSTVDQTAVKPISKSFSDSSSDSGYDESSNQGLVESKIVGKIVQSTTNIAKQDDAKTTIPVKIKTIPVDIPIKLVPLKQIDKILYKPITSASPVIVANANSHQNINVVASNPLVDFAMHASARQSIAN